MYYGKLLRQIVETFRELINRSDANTREIGEKIEQHGAAISDASEAQNETWKEIPSHLAALRIPDDERAKSDTYRKKAHRQQVLLTWGTWLAFIAAAVYAGIARNQWVAMDKTYSEMHQQTTLLEKQLEATTAAIITHQFILNWPTTNQALFFVIMNNRGKVPGTTIRAHFHVSIISLPSGKPTGKILPDWDFSIPEIEASAEAPPERGTSLNVAREELDSIGMPKRVIKLTGTITYFNGFRDYIEPVCYYGLGDVRFLDKNGKVGSAQGSKVLICDEFPSQIAWYRDNERNTRK
jgi:hypothetical protein